MINSPDNPRMSNDVKIPAILVLPIQYTKCEKQGEIVIPAETMVYIDTLNSVALIGTDHVHIDRHEYKLILC